MYDFKTNNLIKKRIDCFKCEFRHGSKSITKLDNVIQKRIQRSRAKPRQKKKKL